MTHTPTPWIIFEVRNDDDHNILFDEKLTTQIGTAISDEDAEHIVKCVNAHDKLVKALETIIEHQNYVASFNGSLSEMSRTIQIAVKALESVK